MGVLLDFEVVINSKMTNIKIEKVGDINAEYVYLEVFINENKAPFLEIGISQLRDLYFKFYPCKNELQLSWKNGRAFYFKQRNI